MKKDIRDKLIQDSLKRMKESIEKSRELIKDMKRILK